MNWPPLSSKTSEALAEVLRDCVHKKPKDLFGHVAQALQEMSGLDAEEFERHFEACVRKPRTYILEERCPAGQDPMVWVPMRYNDDTILLTLERRTGEITSEILSALPIGDMMAYLDRLCIALPELMYIRSSPSEPVADLSASSAEELAVFQAFRAVYVGCSGCDEVTFDDEHVELSFLCEALCREARGSIMQPARCESTLEALLVFLMLRALGTNQSFRGRFGGGVSKTPEQAALHAVENEVAALPSFHRLTEHQQALIRAALQAFFPADVLISTEATPAHFLKAKDCLVPCPGAVDLFTCALVVDHMVRCRAALVRDEVVDFVKIGTHCLGLLDKHSAPRAYEQFLKKRAERHGWRIVRDDFSLKAIVRLCCFAGHEDEEAWNQMLSAMEGLPEREQEVLKTELVRKDGCTDSPVCFLPGVGKFFEAACTNPAVGPRPALLLLARILEDAGRLLTGSLQPNQRMVTIDLPTCARRAKQYAPGGVPFEDTQFTLEGTGSGGAVLRLAGDSV